MVRSPLVLTAAVFLAVMARPADACTCKTPAFRVAAARATAVFAGSVVSVKEEPVDPDRCRKRPAWCVHRYTYTFRVDRVWKGAVPTTVVVDAGHGRGDCSFGRLRGEGPWLVVAEGPTDRLRIRTCGGTRRGTPRAFEQAADALGPPTHP